ncbi:ENTH-domain-containing protein [Calocera cornea HHB12733]|uniref:ENTH-domain-containing protein n=1 Tax=Calocera cornea HHB12733 TaxID=1353952 RepID=A0A165HKD5_9BASI|nr:ENTH-domain-containing protein [Calocera cornea HHB12733]
MDRLEQLGNQISQISMYDIKSFYNQAKNMVLNVSEMEAKVREATNDDAWGASSTLMQEIAQGTFNFQQFNEIMPSIYNRFMEKEARQWRQIYKALQLLEYIVKHGSERVVDDARAHLATIKMLRNFHYIDDKGKDQGINIRNRSRELAELLQDVEKIRTERRKAKANRTKYIGVGSDGSNFGSSGRYSGFGSEGAGSGGGSYSGYGNENSGYGGGGSSYDQDYGGSSAGGFRDQTSRRQFDEYDAGEDEDEAPRRSNSVSQSRHGTTGRTSDAVAPPPPPAASKPREVNLLDAFDDDIPAVSVPAVSAAAGPATDFDDFDDFQAAPVSPQVSAPVLPSKPAAPTRAAGGGLFDLLDSAPAPAKPTYASAPLMASVAQPSRPSMAAAPMPSFTSVNSSMLSPSLTSAPKMGTPAATSKPASGGAFDDLWSMSLGSSAPKPAAAASSSGSKTMLDLQREKAQSSLWGQGTGTGGAAKPAGSGGFDDLLL